MKIRSVDFDFDILRASDAERFEQAARQMQDTAARVPRDSLVGIIRAAAPSASSGRSSEGAAGAALRFSQAGSTPRRENRLSARGGAVWPALPPCTLPQTSPAH